ncbi:MAG TPA: tetratricopeptide repeat protein, partial [Thermoanaerobaculia bacterium]
MKLIRFASAALFTCLAFAAAASAAPSCKTLVQRAAAIPAGTGPENHKLAARSWEEAYAACQGEQPGAPDRLAAVLGWVSHRIGSDPAAAEKIIRAEIEAVSAGDRDHAALVDLHVELGSILVLHGNYAEALRANETALRLGEKLHGPKTIATATLVLYVGRMHEIMNNLAVAETMYRQAIDTMK